LCRSSTGIIYFRGVDRVYRPNKGSLEMREDGSLSGVEVTEWKANVTAQTSLVEEAICAWRVLAVLIFVVQMEFLGAKDFALQT
jgi:hypothetical protein